MRAGPQARLAFALQEAGSLVRRAVEGLTEEQMSQLAIDGWSVKDHLVHLTVWHEMRFHEVSRIARGGQAAYRPLADEQVDAFNSLTVALRRHLAVSQVLEDLDFARSLVAEAIAGCPEDALDENKYGEVSLTGVQHDFGHAETIKNWRQKEGL
ncbi:MAG: maleylpyruvate isomerase N-terminal domain-containing protein [Dehalococcoidia bacterium]|nr:maleylpyruvate isomerase N-terminal domain-containing protein [Dehalococcoidia bacterium]